MGRVATFALICAVPFVMRNCLQDAGTFVLSFAFLCVFAGPISFIIVTVYAVKGARERMRERSRLRAPRVSCDAADRIGQRVMLAGRVATVDPLRDPISGEDVVHYEILIGGPKAVFREVAAGGITTVYGVSTFTDVERDARTGSFELADDTGVVGVVPDQMIWMSVEPRPEDEHEAARAAYLAERGAKDVAWVIHRRVPIGAEILAIGVLGEEVVPDAAGYRGGQRTELRLRASGGGYLIGSPSLDGALKRLGFGEVFYAYLVGAAITLAFTALGVGPFLLAWLLD